MVSVLLTLPTAHHLLPHVSHTLRPDCKPNQIGRHHHQNVEDATERCQMPIPARVAILQRSVSQSFGQSSKCMNMMIG